MLARQAERRRVDDLRDLGRELQADRDRGEDRERREATSVFARASVWWLLLATFVITLAELCISVVGLELAFRRALPGTRSAITGAFLATTFVGDLFGGMFAQLYGRVSPGTYFLLQAMIATGAALAFGTLARRDVVLRAQDWPGTRRQVVVPPRPRFDAR